jgi:nucleoside-diphosphate-sugar epimerase
LPYFTGYKADKNNYKKEIDKIISISKIRMEVFVSGDNVFITGATGFIGSHVLKRVIDQGYSAFALVRPGHKKISEIRKSGAKVIIGDLENLHKVESDLKKIDIVIHCAGYCSDWGDKTIYEEINVRGTHNLCRIFSKIKIKRLLAISTNDVFGNKSRDIITEQKSLTYWQEPYPDSKIDADNILWDYHSKKKLPVALVYPCWVYGEGDKTFVPSLVKAIKNKDMVFWRKNLEIWPTYISNLVDLMMILIKDRRAVGEGYLVHDGKSETLQDFCKKLADSLNLKAPTLHIPYFMAWLAAKIMEGFYKLLHKKNRPMLTTYIVKNMGARLKFSIEKVNRHLNWKPSHTTKEGMAETIEWLKNIDLSNMEVK